MSDTSVAEPAGNSAFATIDVGWIGRINTINNLTIANGMTAGYGDNDGNLDNPPAYTGPSGNTYGGNPKTAPQRIGLMRNIAGSGLPISTLYFIFNPNEIQVAFSTNLNSIPPMYLYGTDVTTALTDVNSASSQAGLAGQTSNSTSVPNLTNSQVVSWSLIFDRTYDMLFDSNPDENRGVLKDVAALYNLMGTFAGNSQAGVPISTPVECIFAITSSGQIWGITGYISSVTITYGIFRHNMIPSRCEVDLQMTTTYVGPTAPTSASGIGTPASISSGQTSGAGGLVVLPVIPGVPGGGVQGPPVVRQPQPAGPG